MHEKKHQRCLSEREVPLSLLYLVSMQTVCRGHQVDAVHHTCGRAAVPVAASARRRARVPARRRRRPAAAAASPTAAKPGTW